MTIQRALVSVSDKTGLVPFVEGLVNQGIEIISTGGTKRVIDEAGLPVTAVEDVTNFPEILDGRVKTLHPKIHGGLLAKRDNQTHQQQLQAENISHIDLVVANLYPFTDKIAEAETTNAEAAEYIDIGGPSMLRAAAKNYDDVVVVVDSRDYDAVLTAVKNNDLQQQHRLELAAKVFRHTAAYDQAIGAYLTRQAGETYPDELTLSFQKKQDLRYGENPQQTAAFYEQIDTSAISIAGAIQHHGKALSYNNIRDADAALGIIQDFSSESAVVAVKHMNPCGIGSGDTLQQAFLRAYDSDPISIFGGIVAVNQEIDEATAKQLSEIFLEIIIAPAFSTEAFSMLTQKKNVRLLTVDLTKEKDYLAQLTSVHGGLLVQDEDQRSLADAELSIPTQRKPTDDEWQSLTFAWKAVKHVKSNAIVLATAQQTVGVGGGQMNRVGAANIAIKQAGAKTSEAALASDAFFPMPDTIEAAGEAGVQAIIQPGGSIRDNEVIEKADAYGIAMVMTKVRHFKH